MSGHYYLVSSLPPLPASVEEPPPLTLDALVDALRLEGGAPWRLGRAILLEPDLRAREVARARHDPDPRFLVLDDVLAEDGAPGLLDAGEDDGRRRVPHDAVWERYAQWALAVSAAEGSTLLAAYTRYNLALRNALARARAARLGLDAEPSTVLAEEALDDAEVTDPVLRWSQAATPLEAELALDRARWEYLVEAAPWFTFSLDEVADYALRLVLGHRWNATRTHQGQKTLEEVVG
jgi:hypothetical protein